jgi:DNA (cytosine-5)-methyltransferase 1
MNYLSVCSGIEAATVAWDSLGFKPIGFSEIEPFPCAILKHHFPNTPNYGNLKEYKQWPIEPGTVDLLVGGTPCQSFSVAGLRGGLEDPRGNLSLTFLALAEKIKPKYIVWENVPGVLSSNGGRDFACFLGGLGKLGYGWAYRVLDASYFGVPQRRRRVFVVACLGDETAPSEILSIKEGLLGHIEQSRKKREKSASNPGESVEDGSIVWREGDNTNAREFIDKAGTLTCNKGQLGGYIYPFRKSRRAQSITDNETWVEGEYSNTLNKFDTGEIRTTHIVVSSELRKHNKITERDLCPTLTEKSKFGDNKPLALQEGMQLRRLTPIECERLQGFPDDWTLIPWKGKPIDRCPDGLRYKAIGNSMAVPCMKWIGERIKQYEFNKKV